MIDKCAITSESCLGHRPVLKLLETLGNSDVPAFSVVAFHANYCDDVTSK